MEITLSNALEDVDENEPENDDADGDADEAFVPLEESDECDRLVFGWRNWICRTKTNSDLILCRSVILLTYIGNLC